MIQVNSVAERYGTPPGRTWQLNLDGRSVLDGRKRGIPDPFSSAGHGSSVEVASAGGRRMPGLAWWGWTERL